MHFKNLAVFAARFLSVSSHFGKFNMKELNKVLLTTNPLIIYII